MAFEQRDNSGTCFVNDRKESDKHPDWSGSGMIGGKMFWISMWEKTSASGKKMRTLSFKPKEERGGQSQGAPPRETGGFRPPQRYEPPRSSPPPEEEEPNF